MKRITNQFLATLGGMALVTGAAMAQPKPASPVGDTPTEAAQKQSAAVDAADKEFMHRAAESGLLEVEASKLAEDRAHSDEVKTFAHAMIKDHTEANLELETITKKKGLAPPLFPSDAQKAKLQALSNVEGEEFDRLYAKEIGVMAHQEAVDLFSNATTNVSDAELKAYAVKTLPRLKKHLGMAQDLERKVSGTK